MSFQNFLYEKLEEITGGVTGFSLSAAITDISLFIPIGLQGELVTQGVKTVFVLINTGLGVVLAHYIKKRLNKNK